MRLRDALHHELAKAFGTHAADPLVQQIAGLRRIGAAVFDVEQELVAAEAQAGGRDLRRARCYFAALETMVTFADAFVLDAFADPEHPRHVPEITFEQARAFYLRTPDLATAVRQEIAYSGGATLTLPILPGPRLEAAGRCPMEHLMAMQRAAGKVEEVMGTRIEALRLHASEGPEPAGLRPAVLRMAGARTKMSAADQVLGALQQGQHVAPEVHEQAEALYFDGVLRVYLYAAQELELPGVTASAPETEQEPEVEAAPPDRPSADDDGGFRGRGRDRDDWGQGYGMGQGGGFSLGGLIAADVVGSLIGDLLGGLFGGGGGFGRW